MLLKTANKHAKNDEKPYSPPSEAIRKNKMKVLGHVLRSPQEDPMRTVTVKRKCKFITPKKRRVGRPRLHWANTAFISANNKLAETDNEYQYHENKEKYIDKYATKRIFKLAQDKNKWRESVVYQPYRLQRP